jgi:hypothetical protein
MDRIYFRQEVLTKYEGAAGFDVKDDGSVSCQHYWGLLRSTSRLGNELLSTAIGDFAEGVPFEEWPHWKQYAVEPPCVETVKALVQEPEIPEVVNSVVAALKRLNAVFANLAEVAGVTLPDPIWLGSLDSLAGRQLKWVYPATADDDEFLKRATLTSTLVLDGLQPPSMRALVRAFGANLHQTFDKDPKPLGSRKLLRRVTLAARIVEGLQPDLKELPLIVQQAEGKATNVSPDLQTELEGLFKQVRSDFAPLAFLYDLRISGGPCTSAKQRERGGGRTVHRGASFDFNARGTGDRILSSPNPLARHDTPRRRWSVYGASLAQRKPVSIAEPRSGMVEMSQRPAGSSFSSATKDWPRIMYHGSSRVGGASFSSWNTLANLARAPFPGGLT